MFVSYDYQQPYYQYIENYSYDVIPGTVTLTFDSAPSTDPADYKMTTAQGILMFSEMVGFTTYDGTLALSGNTATLTLPINMDTGVVMQFYYQGVALPFRIRANEDYSYETPAIFQGVAYTAS